MLVLEIIQMGHLLNWYLDPWGPPGTKAVLGLASSDNSM